MELVYWSGTMLLHDTTCTVSLIVDNLSDEVFNSKASFLLLLSINFRLLGTDTLNKASLLGV